MSLTASPFDPATGRLLPVYRDAYLRGDLSDANTRAVDAYLKARRGSGDETLRRFYEMKQEGEQVRPVGWVQRQFDLVRTAPQRLRRRVAGLVAAVVLVAGAVLAGNAPEVEVAAERSLAAEASGRGMSMVKGRILDENGHPLVGATVLVRGSQRGVSTNAQGEYALLVPAQGLTTLAYGYAGYEGEEVDVRGGRTESVTLLPREKAKPVRPAKRWWLF
ncbi:carboxypeptidase-like regulatory domain-containing protein [Hymenobacter koreensis]|uniref:Carboxypeptidase-like regulatory domain-containing protein n=1 Tax=Hymenobacter koreensis TaxID=1084523 RepID=A0ABP8JDY0_9BACT